MLTLFRHTNIAQMKWNSKNNYPDDFKKTKALRLLFFKGVNRIVCNNYSKWPSSYSPNCQIFISFCLIFLIASTSNLLNAVISLDANKALIFAKTYHNITLGYIPLKFFIPISRTSNFSWKSKVFFQRMESLTMPSRIMSIKGRRYAKLLS